MERGKIDHKHVKIKKRVKIKTFCNVEVRVNRKIMPCAVLFESRKRRRHKEQL
jgi:hypothetical protein